MPRMTLSGMPRQRIPGAKRDTSPGASTDIGLVYQLSGGRALRGTLDVGAKLVAMECQEGAPPLMFCAPSSITLKSYYLARYI